MRLRFFSILFVLFLTVSAFAQSKIVTAPNGQTYKISGTDGFRGNDELWLYTASYYAKKPTSNAGVDVYVVDGKVTIIQDRAGKVFLEQKPDPGAIAVGAGGFILSGNGAARRWILANLKIGDAVSIPGMTGNAGSATATGGAAAANLYAYPGFGMIAAANNKTYYFDGKNAARGANQMFVFTPEFYAKTPPASNGVDVLIKDGKVAEIRDRAGAVYIEKKPDPGALKIDDAKNSYVLSGGGEARKWILANLKTGENVGLSGLDLSKEVPPMASIPCFAGAHYRKAVSSFDVWTGIAGFVKLGTPKVDEARLDPKDNQPLDNFSVYMGGSAGGKYEVDAGLTWEFSTDANGKKSERRNAWRPFWRTKTWNSAPDKPEYTFKPGDTIQMAILVAGAGKLRMIIADAKNPQKQFTVDFDAEGFAPGVPRQFKRVNAIDQRYNEGKPVRQTKAEVVGAEWINTILLRGEGGGAKQIPMDATRFTDMRCGATVNVITVDAAKGAEKIDIFGTPKQ